MSVCEERSSTTTAVASQCGLPTVFAELVALGHYSFKSFLKPKPIMFSCTRPFEKKAFLGSHYFGKYGKWISVDLDKTDT